MQESEAKTKWCPFSVVRDAGVPAAVNRASNRPEDCRCFGSGCMAWRGTGAAGRCGLASDKDAP